MIYHCFYCHTASEADIWENVTLLVGGADYFIPFGGVGWLNSTYYCPVCEEHNAGYDLKTEDEFFGLHTYEITWKDKEKKGITLSGRNFPNAMERAGMFNDILHVKHFKEVKDGNS